MIYYWYKLIVALYLVTPRIVVFTKSFEMFQTIENQVLETYLYMYLTHMEPFYNTNLRFIHAIYQNTYVVYYLVTWFIPSY